MVGTIDLGGWGGSAGENCCGGFTPAGRRPAASGEPPASDGTSRRTRVRFSREEMSRLDDLSIGWLSLAVFAALYIVAGVIYVVVLALATGRRAQAFKAVSPGLLPPMGLLFALLVGFLVAQVWNAAERAEAAVDREASALRSVDLLTGSFPAEPQVRMRVLLRRHIEEAVNREWPAMAEGSATLTVIPAALNDAIRLAVTLTPRTEGQKTAQREIVASLQDALDARRQRIIVSESSIDAVKWAAVLALALLTLCAIGLVHSDNRTTTRFAMGLFAVAVAVVITMLAAQNQPFAGQLGIDPDVLEEVLPRGR